MCLIRQDERYWPCVTLEGLEKNVFCRILEGVLVLLLCHGEHFVAGHKLREAISELERRDCREFFRIWHKKGFFLLAK